MDLGFIIQSFIVYGLTATILYALGKKYRLANLTINYENVSNPRGTHFLIWISIVFAAVSGLRHLTGSDTAGYVEQYNLMLNNPSYEYDHFEKGWTYLCRLLVSLGFDANAYLFIVALIQIIGLLYYFRRKPYLIPYLGIAIIITGEFLNLWNGLRQETVTYLFFPLIFFLEKKKFCWFVVALFLLSLLHKSAYILVFFYPLYLYGKVIIPNKWHQCFFLLLCIYLGGNSVWIHSIDYIESLSGLLGYEQDINLVTDYIESFEKQNIGFRTITKYSMFFLAILYSDKMVERFRSKQFCFMYNAFLIFVFTDSLFTEVRVFNRIFVYAQPYSMIIYAYLLSFLLQTKNQTYKTVGYGIVLLLALSLATSIITSIGDGTALYKCILWDS